MNDERIFHPVIEVILGVLLVALITGVVDWSRKALLLDPKKYQKEAVKRVLGDPSVIYSKHEKHGRHKAQ